MADPITIAMVASTAMKTVGGLVSGLSAASAAGAEADQARASAGVASAQADAREEQSRRQARQTLGEQVASIAQSGAGFTQTSRDTMDQSAANASLDALNARYAGALERTNDLNQAAQLDAKARSLKIGAWLGAGGSALQAVAPYLGGGASLQTSGDYMMFDTIKGPQDIGKASSTLPAIFSSGLGG